MVWLLIGFAPDFALTRMVTVMVVACPHALGLAIPLVTVNATAIDSTGDGVDSTNDESLWSNASGTIELVARRGSASPGTPEGV